MFNAVTETFEVESGIPRLKLGNRCAATMGKVTGTVGVMVGAGSQTHFFQLCPPGSGRWEQFSANNAYLGPVLGRVSSNEMVLGGNANFRIKNEIFKNLSPFWENKGWHIPFPVYGRSTQVPASWIKRPNANPFATGLSK